MVIKMNNNNNNRPDSILEKIEFTKEQLEEIDKINKGDPIKKTRISTNNKSGYTYEYTNNKPLTYSVGSKRLLQLYGGMCTSCGQWPSHKVSYDVGDENQGAWLVQRYCSSCFSKWKSRK
jgi:hypothetical protein